jgi:SNF2 family DNA or RNA helicase
VVVFATFKNAVAGIAKTMIDAGIKTGVITGDTPSADRDRILHALQNTDDLKVLVAHPQTVSHGVTLTAASTVIWAGPITSLDIYSQAVHRIRRVGQKQKQQFIHLQSSKMEERIYSLLINKNDIQTELLTMFES